ncbi:phospholipase [Kistimonas asteriae]|uniref:phospholipase n=1 Tax=Kistimonas asteriae TaxID=517724 RepID=UPI001BAD8BDF|nr:phospholipase [Kistimonas asteriae]
MRRLFTSASLTGLLLCTTADVNAFTQPTHKRIVIDAVNYMAANPDTTAYARLQSVAQAAGITIDQLADYLGQGAFDVDDFEDTYMCGAITGDCVRAPVWGLGASIVSYTSYWHFQNHTRGPDNHGNDIGGYNYNQLTVAGAIDNMAATWLVGDHLDDGRGGMAGWFGSEGSEYNSYGITETNYRQGSYSSKSMYKDFEKIPFQPIDNLGQYWYNEFWRQPTIQTLGFTLHTTDLLQPHHTWTTSDHNHSGWEGWVEDYYDQENLNDTTQVEQALMTLTPPVPGNPEIRPLLTQGGAYSYANGGIVLSSQDHNDRVRVARQVIPHAIAMVVHILNHAAERF